MKINKILSFGLLVTTLMGCSKDFLETAPANQVGQQAAENTPEGLTGIVNGIHSMMYRYANGQVWGYGQQSLAAQYDMLGDDMINTRPAFHMSTYRYTGTVDITSNDQINYLAWDFYYTVIQHANKVIGGAEKANLQESQKRAILGEAYAFRAWAYHYLVQLFSKRYEKGAANDHLGVILRTPEKMEENLPRSTVAQTYALIDGDIQQALTYLEQVPNRGKNTIRYATACGIAARIALTKSDWENAEKYAKLAIEKSGASLQTGNALLDGFNNYNATEWMWGYAQTSDQNLYYAHFNASYSYNFNTSYTNSLRFAVNRDIFDLMGADDVRRKWWVCLDLGNTIPADAYTGYFGGGTDLSRATWEITGQQIKFKAQSATDSSGNTLLMRLAEMYYILAEAQARQGKDGDAQTTLNTIMITRDSAYNTTATGTALIDEVMRNKRIDLWMEGHRFFDMKRLGIVPDRLNSKNIQVYLTGVRKTTAITRNSGNTVANVPTTVDSKYWQFAIPYAEMRANPLCEQNEL